MRLCIHQVQQTCQVEEAGLWKIFEKTFLDVEKTLCVFLVIGRCHGLQTTEKLESKA